MNNPVKLLVGAALGSAVGYGISKYLELQGPPPVDPETGVVVPRETFRERWARAQAAGEAAKLAKEEELRAYFRLKVHDPEAMRENPRP
jgi:hypothetical protein